MTKNPIDQRLQSLKALYESKQVLLSNVWRETNLKETPLLIWPEAYLQQPIRLFVVGQESSGTCEWSKAWDENGVKIDPLLGAYTPFRLQKTLNPRPFWNVTRKLEKQLGIAPDSRAWTNLNRFSEDGRPPTGETLEVVKTLDFLVREEISILQPHILIFYTNRSRDGRLRKLYDGLQIEQIDQLPWPHFARLLHRELPSLTFRTPHPSAIRRRHWENGFVEFIENQGRCLQQQIQRT